MCERINTCIDIFTFYDLSIRICHLKRKKKSLALFRSFIDVFALV